MVCRLGWILSGVQAVKVIQNTMAARDPDAKDLTIDDKNTRRANRSCGLVDIAPSVVVCVFFEFLEGMTKLIRVSSSAHSEPLNAHRLNSSHPTRIYELNRNIDLCFSVEQL